MIYELEILILFSFDKFNIGARFLPSHILIEDQTRFRMMQILIIGRAMSCPNKINEVKVLSSKGATKRMETLRISLGSRSINDFKRKK